MNSAIRMFALLVAISGLAAASFAPATTQPLTKHASMAASGPGPVIGPGPGPGPIPGPDLPAPPPCTMDGTCLVQSASNR